MTDPVDLPPIDDEPELDRPTLRAIASAILEGRGIDWDAVALGADPGYLNELQALANVVSAHVQLPGAPASARAAPARWGNLEVRERIGGGAFGDVYRAYDPRVDRTVALKLLHEAVDSSAADAVIAEARSLARIRHPSVVTVFGAEHLDDRTGIWTELVEGITLAAMVHEEGPVSVDTAVDIGMHLCSALAAVHRAGVVHGDIKAQNVLRDAEGRVVLVDFGTSRDVSPDRLAESKSLSGTPVYMAPELWQLAPPTAQSDIYSLGVLLYYLVTGTYPVHGATAEDVRGAHAAGRRVPLREARSELPRRFVDVVERAAAIEPSRRFQMADEFGAALARVAAPSAARRRVIAGAAAATFVAAAIVTLWIWPRSVPQAHERRVQLVDYPRGIYGGKPSRDGRVFPYSDLNGQLAVWDPVTRGSQVITAPHSTDYAGPSLASGDGSSLVYSWVTPSGEELRLTVTDGSSPPRVLLPAATADSYEPLEWTRDGRFVLCWLFWTGRRQLALVPVDGTTPKILQQFSDFLRAGHASVSPDGAWVAFAAPQAPGERLRDVTVAAVDGSRSTAITPSPADDWSPVWTGDGRVLFLSTRQRSTSLYVVRVEDGGAMGEPALAARDLGVVFPIGLTDTGTYVYERPSRDADVYLMPLDPTGERPPGAPAAVTPAVIGNHVGGSWSPDGLQLAYIDHLDKSVVVQDRAGALLRVHPVRSFPLGNARPRWHPDGRRLLVRGQGAGYFEIDLASADEWQVVSFDNLGDDLYGWFGYSPDGGAIQYWHIPRGLVRREFGASAAETILVPRGELADRNPRFDVSRRGVLAAAEVPLGRQSAAAATTIKVRRESASVEVARIPGRARLQHWTADGRGLVFVRPSSAHASVFHLWIVDVETSQQRDLGALSGYRMTVNADLSLHPDGTVVAYTQGVFSTDAWIMEGFLAR